MHVGRIKFKPESELRNYQLIYVMTPPGTLPCMQNKPVCEESTESNLTDADCPSLDPQELSNLIM